MSALSILDRVRMVPSALKIFPCEVGLCNFRDNREEGPKEGSLSRITIREGLIPDVESSFLRFTDVEELPINHAKRSRITWAM